MTKIRARTGRVRKERFIQDFGDRAAKQVVDKLFDRYGLAMLPDDLLDEAVSDLVREWRFHERLNRQNRAIRAHAGDTP